MTLESQILTVLAEKEANAADIAREIGVETADVVGVLRRLQSAGLLVEVERE